MQSSSTHAFETKYVEVHQCKNDQCRHLFAVNTISNTGVHSFINDQNEDYSIYKERNYHLIKYWVSKNFIKSKYKVLDFGSGIGHILGSMIEQMPDLEISGVEYEKEYHENLLKSGVKVYKSMKTFPLPQNLMRLRLSK